MTNLFNSLALFFLFYRVNCDIPVVGDIANDVLGGHGPNTSGTSSNGGGLSVSLIDNKQALGSVGGSENKLADSTPNTEPMPIMASSYAMQPMTSSYPMQPMTIQPHDGTVIQASGSMNQYQYPMMCDAYNQCYQAYNYGYGQYPANNYNPAPYYSNSAYNPSGYPYYTTM